MWRYNYTIVHTYCCINTLLYTHASIAVVIRLGPKLDMFITMVKLSQSPLGYGASETWLPHVSIVLVQPKGLRRRQPASSILLQRNSVCKNCNLRCLCTCTTVVVPSTLNHFEPIFFLVGATCFPCAAEELVSRGLKPNIITYTNFLLASRDSWHQFVVELT